MYIVYRILYIQQYCPKVLSHARLRPRWKDDERRDDTRWRCLQIRDRSCIYTSVRNKEDEGGSWPLAKKKVDFLKEAWLGPRRNGNRFDHKQTVALFGSLGRVRWAADRMSCIRLRTNTPDPSCLQTACPWNGNVGAGSRISRIGFDRVRIYLTHRSRPRITHSGPRFLGKYAKNGYARCALYRLENDIYVSCSVHSNARVFHFATRR